MNNEIKTFEVQISEKTWYSLNIKASSKTEARKIVRAINNGDACITDFDGGDAPSGSPIVIHSVKELS